MSLEDDLAITTGYVTNVRRSIAQQLVRIVKLADAGCSTWDAQENLQAFRSTLSVLEGHERRLRDMQCRAASA